MKIDLYKIGSALGRIKYKISNYRRILKLVLRALVKRRGMLPLCFRFVSLRRIFFKNTYHATRIYRKDINNVHGTIAVAITLLSGRIVTTFLP